MFSTKKEVAAWINDYGKGRQFEPRMGVNYWRIYDLTANRFLQEDQIGEIEETHESP